MRKVKQIALVAGILLFASGTNVHAQDADSFKKTVKKEEQDIKKKKDQEAAKLKDKTNAVKGDASKQLDDAKADAMSGGATNDKITELREKLKKAKTDKERQEIKKMIEQEMIVAKKKAGNSVDDAKNDASTAVGNAKDDASATIGGVKDDASSVVTNDGNGTASTNVVRADNATGKALSDAAIAKLEKKEMELAQKEKLVQNGRARVASAKNRLAAAIAKGNLTEDQIAKKSATIEKVEARLNKLESSINAGKATYSKQKNTLSDLIKN